MSKRTLVLFSGGIGSFNAACLLQDQGKKIELLFCDTLMEDPDLYRFIDEASAKLQVPLRRISYGKNVFDLAIEQNFMPNSRVDLCSRILKRDLTQDWLKHRKHRFSEVAIGIDWTEIHRYEKAKPYWDPMPLIAPLIDNPIPRNFYLEKHGIREPDLYRLGFHHNNCGGFCVKGGLKQFKHLLEQKPEYYSWCEEMEERVFDRIGKKHPFLKKNGKYISLREYRIFLQKENSIDEHDWGGCSCGI